MMTLDEKLYKQMILRGLTQQALSARSGVSDSEVSRLLNGQSKRPSLRNVARLARALGVSVDYLADDRWESDPYAASASLSEAEHAVLERSRRLGHREAALLLDVAEVIGPEAALRRLCATPAEGPIRRPAAAGSRGSASPCGTS